MNNENMVISWINTHQESIVTIGGIIIVALIITHFGEQIINRAVARAIKPQKYVSRTEELKREKTISTIISRMLKILVWPFAVMSIVAQLGVEIAPLIAGAGIVGLALGFGAQSLVKDMIAGLFVIIENQYRVGDVVALEGVSGTVEDITLRKTTLRDLDGVVHHIPNGIITMASNFSSEYSGINLDINVSYNTNIEKVTKVINDVGLAMLEDKQWSKYIIEQPVFLRVENFGPSEIVLKITGKVQPLSQWEVTGELRKRLKVAFDKNNIEIPFPQSVVHQLKG